MARQEEVGLLIKLKDGVTKVFDKAKSAGNSFATGMKTAMGKVVDVFKSSMFSAVALGTAITQMGMRAIASIRQWITEAKSQFQTFEESITAVYTLLDKDTFNENAKDIEQGAIKVMQKYNLTIEDTNKALFDAVSAGIEAGNATQFLEQAARLAKGGVTNLSVAVDGMTSIINAYGLEQDKANEVADAFFTAQKFGKTTVEELSSSIGKVAPIAKAAGMSYQEVLAALSQMTLAGISTDEAVTALKGTLTAIVSPTEESAKKFQELGIPMGGAAFEGGKFSETMEKIQGSTKGNIDTITELIPNIRGLLGVTSVTTEEGLQKYDDILKEIKTDHESLTDALEKQMGVLKEQIATEKGKLLPLKLQTGKILSKVELAFLKLGNAAREVTNIYQQSFGVWGTMVGYMQKIADKVLTVTGLKKAEHEQEKEIIAEKEEIADEQMEREIERDAEKKEILATQSQEFLDRKAELDKIAENVRIKLEEQKKNYDQMTADQKIKLITDTLGQERLLKTNAQIEELVSRGKYNEAKLVQDQLYKDAFKKNNKDMIADANAQWRKHWDAQIAMSIFGKDMTKKEYDAMGQVFSDVMNLMGKESIAAFRVMQGVAIVNTLMATYESATKAFNSLAGISIVGTILGGIAAGAAIASGLKNVDEIRRQRPPQAETGAYVAKGGYAELHPQEAILTKEQTAGLAAGGMGAQHIYLQLDGETVQKWIINTDREANRMERVGLR